MYLLIENFNSGLDSRRMALTSRPGTLQRLENAHITRGGEIEKRKAFDAIASLPNGTFGLHSANGALWVFGSQDGLVPNVYGTLPPDPAPESFYIPRVNYMKLGVGVYSTLRASPFCIEMGPTTIRPAADIVGYPTGMAASALVVDIPETGESPTSAYQVFHVTFNTSGGPPNGLYYVNKIRENTSGKYKLIIYSKKLNDSTVLDYQFSIYKGSISWTSNQSPNSSTAKTTASSSSYEIIVRSTSKLSYNIQPSACIDAFWVYPSPKSIANNPNAAVTACSFLCRADGYIECNFLTTQSPSGTALNFYIAFEKSGINSLSYFNGTNLRQIVSGQISFYPSSVSDWSKYATARSWVAYAADLLATKINLQTSSSGLSALSQDGVISVSGDDAFYHPNPSVTSEAWILTSEADPLPIWGSQPGLFVYSLNSKFTSTTQMTELLAVDNFKGKIYAIAKFEGGAIAHFYNGKRVISWDAIASSSGDPSSIAALFALEIVKDGEYESTSLDNKVFIQFFKKNTAYPVFVNSINGGNLEQSILISTIEADIDSPQLTTIEILGDYEQLDVFSVTVGNQAYTVQAGGSVVGRFCKTHMDKMYSASGSLLYFSETSTNGGPSAFTNDTNNGAGVINLSSQDSGSSELTSIALYQGRLAIFSRSCVQVWTMNADPKLNAFSQILNNVGTAAPRSVVSLGNIDTYFLSQLGVRSLKARDASNVAIVSDVGNPIDDMILRDLSQLSSSKREAAVGMIDPVDGRYWLSVGPKIYVYSYFPSSNINAWSVYLPTTGPDRIPLEVSHLCTLNDRIYARSGNFIFAYGGLTGGRYDESEVKVQMPYLDGGKPGHFKTLAAVDSACEGEWDVWSGADIMAPDVFDYIGKIKNSTYSMGRVSAVGIGTHICIKMESKYDGYARIGNLAVHFEINDAG